MKIAIFSDIFYPELSGITDSIIETGKELAKRGHEIDYFVPAYSLKDYKISGVTKGESIIDKNIKIHRITSFRANAPTMQGRTYIPSMLGRIFSRRKYDIIHSQTFFGAGFEALALSKIRGIPLVGTNHTLIEAFSEFMPFPQFTKNLLRKYVIWYYNRCKNITVPSEFLLDHMKKDGLNVNTQVVSNPIDREFFEVRDKNFLKKTLALPGFTLLYVGRLSAEKNIDILLDAFIPFANKNPDTCLVLIGNGVLRKKLEIKAKKSGVSSQIKIVGPFLGKNRKSLYDYFHASDAFVMPSTSETQSMSTIQAMASGLPIIAARSGPLGEFSGEKTGVQFEPYNVRELEAIFDNFYKNSLSTSMLKELGENGRAFAKKFSVETIADEWEKIYADAINKK